MSKYIKFLELWNTCDFSDDANIKEKLMVTYNEYHEFFYSLFKLYPNELADYVIISFGDDSGTEIKEVFIEEDQQENVISIGDYGKMLVLGRDFIDVPTLTYPISTLVFLDTNLVSNIRTLLMKGCTRANGKDILTKSLFLLEAIDEMKCQVNVFPYLYENEYKVFKGYINEEVFLENIGIAMTYADSNLEGLSKLKYSDSKLIGCEDYYEEFNKRLKNNDIVVDYTKHKMIQAIILKSYLIKNSDNSDLNSKKLKLTKFITSELGYHHEFLFILMVEYFDNNTNLIQFLKIINPTTKPKLAEIEGMAFDLLLYDIISRSFLNYDTETITPYFTLPMFATLDRGLKEVISFNPIKAVIINRSNKTASTICRKKLNDYMNTAELVDAYNGEENEKIHARRMLEKNIDDILAGLKAEYLSSFQK